MTILSLFRPVALLAACVCSLAAAQTFPSRPVTLVVPFDPGGATDVLARSIAVPMAKALGQQVLVMNRPGAGARIGAKSVAGSTPDGYTATILGSSSASWPYFFKDPGVDLVKHFVPAGTIVEGSLVIVANARVPFTTMKDAVEYGRRNPGKLTWSLVSRSSEPMLYFARLQELGVQMVEVPYKGSAPQAQAVAAGEVDFGQFAPGRTLALVQAGQAKALAISGDRRDEQLPNVPTMKELGFDGFPNYDFGLYLPVGTSAATVERWNSAMLAALRDPDVLATLTKFGFHPVGSSPAAHQALVRQASEVWRKLTQTARIEPE